MESNDELRDAFYEKHEIEEVEGGYYDDNGFYILPDGDFYDPDGVYFDKDGKDKFGGTYDDNLEYVVSEKYKEQYESLQKEIKNDYDLLAEYGFGGEDEEIDDLEDQNDDETKEYLLREKIPSEKRTMLISFTGMSSNKEDEKAYMDWFKERNITPMQIAINENRLNIQVKTSDMDSILNAVKLEGQPDVDYIKVMIPNVKDENVVIQDADELKVEKDDKVEPKPDEKKKDVDEDDEFEISEN